MAERFFSERNLKFLLYEVFDAESITEYPYYEQYDRKMLDMILMAAKELSEKMLWPIFQDMDRTPVEFIDDQVKVHNSVKTLMEEFGRGGWISTTIPMEHGGEQVPHLVADACQFIFCAANYSASVYPALTSGAAHLIESFGSRELFDTYVPKMHEGKWQGTMALTEPDAGSSLTDLATYAEPTDKGYYSIHGQKIFISAGDYDGVENVIHLLLAKIPGAPPGVRGISLFVVPKNRVEENGHLVPNDVVTSGIFHKLGYRGCPAVQLSLGDKNDCRGYLVGEPHRGLRYMFQMMNESRIRVGMGETGMAAAAYYCALEYATTRKQGRKHSNKDPFQPPVAIIEHPDVKRMLLFQRAVTEGSLSLLMQCSKYVDMQKVCGDKEKENFELLLEVLTPIAKTYPSELGIHSVSQALQCFGGSGICDDYPLEQYYRDVRIHPIHEGTTGIQGLDLLGRKVVMKYGRAFDLYLEEVWSTIRAAEAFQELKAYTEDLKSALEKLQDITSHLKSLLGRDREFGLADATLYLEFFAIICIAWQWLMQATIVQKNLRENQSGPELNFYQGKLYVFRYYFEYELPKIEALARRLKRTDGLTVNMKAEFF